MYGSAASIILELAVIGLLVIGIATGVKKGFFKSLMDVVILAVAIFAAVMVCRWATGYLVDRLYPKAEEKVLSAIENADVDLSNVDLAAMGIDEDHPDTLSDAEYATLKKNAGIGKLANALEKAGIPHARIRAILARTLKKAGRSGMSIKEILSDSAKAATRSGLTVVVQVILFILVLLIVSILLQMLVNGMKGMIWKVDALKTIDRFLGFLLGAVLMLGIILIAFYIFKRISWTVFENAVDQTLFASFINENNPLCLFLE